MKNINWPHGLLVLLCLLFYGIIKITAGPHGGRIGMALLAGKPEVGIPFGIAVLIGALLLLGSIFKQRFFFQITSAGAAVLLLALVVSGLLVQPAIHFSWVSAIPFFLTGAVLILFSFIDRQ